MRDKLIKLLEETGMIEGTSRCNIVADELLANGVIVPPCKVGDTVYKIMDAESVHWQILEMKVLRIEILKTITFYAKTIKKYRYNYVWFTLDDFGKTVFLTQEEAEQALRKEDEGK